MLAYIQISSQAKSAMPPAPSASSNTQTVPEKKTLQDKEKSPGKPEAEGAIEKTQDSDAGKKPSASVTVFSVDRNYVASGMMGDIDDIKIGAGEGGVRQFVYTPTGKGQHEWTYKYKANQENPSPAKFAGVFYLNPPDDFGTSPNCGWDLRGFHRVAWEARSIGESINVEFLIGGIDLVWREDKGMWVRVPPPHPDSMPRTSLGTPTLTNEWKPFSVEIDQPMENFKRVVAGFAWTITWGDNNVNPRDGRKLVLELRNIRYEK